MEEETKGEYERTGHPVYIHFYADSETLSAQTRGGSVIVDPWRLASRKGKYQPARIRKAIRMKYLLERHYKPKMAIRSLFRMKLKRRKRGARVILS